jgi:hypothetical protein
MESGGERECLTRVVTLGARTATKRNSDVLSDAFSPLQVT